MKLSKSAHNLRKVIEKAIEDHRITKAEFENIIHQATEDEHIDNQETALLRQLQEMIEDKSVKVVP
jgi:MFS superfamily sulfate permease-like transporter